MSEYQQGRLLLTQNTKRWTQEQRHAADEQERCMVFKNFSASDEGRSRVFVCKCASPTEAAELVKRLNALPALREKCEELQRKLDESAEQIHQYSIREGKLQRERDEAAKQEPYLFECVAPPGRDDLLDEEKRTIVDSISVADYRDDGYSIAPLYRHPPNLPALIEQERAEDDRILNEVRVFLESLPNDLGRGSLNGMKVQIQEAIRARSEK